MQNIRNILLGTTKDGKLILAETYFEDGVMRIRKEIFSPLQITYSNLITRVEQHVTKLNKKGKKYFMRRFGCTEEELAQNILVEQLALNAIDGVVDNSLFPNVIESRKDGNKSYCFECETYSAELPKEVIPADAEFYKWFCNIWKNYQGKEVDVIGIKNKLIDYKESIDLEDWLTDWIDREVI
jgi:hypothetical protein